MSQKNLAEPIVIYSISFVRKTGRFQSQSVDEDCVTLSISVSPVPPSGRRPTLIAAMNMRKRSPNLDFKQSKQTHIRNRNCSIPCQVCHHVFKVVKKSIDRQEFLPKNDPRNVSGTCSGKMMVTEQKYAFCHFPYEHCGC